MPPCPEHAGIKSGIDEIQLDMKEVLRRLGTGDVNFATIEIRIKNLELIVYGAVGVALLSLATALVGLVIIVK
jgi:hypothetical protein